jgi:hypothetical protein
MVERRSSRIDVRNPMAKLDEVRREWEALPIEAKRALVRMLRALSKDWHARGDKSWATKKSPMAAYWKGNAVNARHLALIGVDCMREEPKTRKPKATPALKVEQLELTVDQVSEACS